MSFAAKFFLSICVFAPGIVILTGLGFVGILMLIEKAGWFDKR